VSLPRWVGAELRKSSVSYLNDRLDIGADLFLVVRPTAPIPLAGMERKMES
jgi:hypothetical protein